MKKHLILKLAALTALVAVIAGFAVFARGAGTSAGTSSDPLVTQSYVDQTFRASLLADVQQKLDAAAMQQQNTISAMSAAFSRELAPAYPAAGAESPYQTIELQAGESLSFFPGQQMLVLSGSGKVSVNMMVDATDGKSLTPGSALTENHFYHIPAEAAITAETALTVMVK